MESMINHAYMIDKKILQVWGSVCFSVGKHTEVLGEWCALPYLCLPTGVSSVFFFTSFYNKLVASIFKKKETAKWSHLG